MTSSEDYFVEQDLRRNLESKAHRGERLTRQERAVVIGDELHRVWRRIQKASKADGRSVALHVLMEVFASRIIDAERREALEDRITALEDYLTEQRSPENAKPKLAVVGARRP
jgi:hypothetical protein